MKRVTSPFTVNHTSDAVSSLHETAGVAFLEISKDEIAPILDGDQQFKKGIVDATLFDQLNPSKVALDRFLVCWCIIDVAKVFLAGVNRSKPGECGEPALHDQAIFLCQVPFP